MIPVFTFGRLDFIVPSEDSYVKTHIAVGRTKVCFKKFARMGQPDVGEYK